MQYKQSVQYSVRSKIAYRQSLLSDLLTYELMMFSIAESPRLAKNTILLNNTLHGVSH